MPQINPECAFGQGYGGAQFGETQIAGGFHADQISEQKDVKSEEKPDSVFEAGLEFFAGFRGGFFVGIGRKIFPNDRSVDGEKR